MDVEALIKCHNEELEEEVNKNPGLKYKVFARATAQKKVRQPDSLKIRKYALVYSLLFLFALFIHFWIIGSIKNKNVPTALEYIVETDSFQADFSGSINQAYLEVINWEN
ncbi:MAG TPA: hypothetical protein VMZ49_00860 [Patescibacteria group bacterium]|nr:hypothetical protein [Patescibacteria group bacterium]